MIDDLKFLREEDSAPTPIIPYETVLVPLKRWEELLEIETRVHVVLDLLAVNEVFTDTTLALLLGNSDLYAQLQEERRRRDEEWERKYKGDKDETVETET
jgi:hypothetical protein